MGRPGWIIVLGATALGCGLVDTDEQGLGRSFCTPTAAGSPRYFLETWQRETDGSVKRSVVVFGALGKLRKTIDHGDDGIVDGTRIYVLDAHGNLIREEQDHGANGTLDQLTLSEYDEFDRQISWQMDEDADGQFDYAKRWDYQVIPRTIEITDADADGSPDSTYAVFYTHEGDLTREEWDADADGVVDDLTLYSYREEENVDEQLTDRGGDGKIDAVRRITWHPVHTANWGSVSVDTDGDGTWDRVREYVYDEIGVLLRIEEDFGDDGTIDEVIRYLDGSNPSTSRVEHERADGGGYAYEYEYRGGGMLAETRLDAGGDGSWDMIETRTDCPG